MKYSYCLATWDSGMTFYVGPWRFHYLSVLQSAQLGRNAWETLAHPVIRDITFVAHGQEFLISIAHHINQNIALLLHRDQHRFNHTELQSRIAALCFVMIIVCIWKPDFKQIHRDSAVKKPSANVLQYFCFILFGVGFFLVGCEQNTSHQPN